MAIPSSLTSKLLSFISPTNNNNNNNNNNNKTQLQTSFKVPIFSPSTSISLKSHKNPDNKNGLLVPKMGTYNVQIVVEDNEHEDRLLNRFRREVFRAGIIQESKRRRFFENSQEKRKRKIRDAAKRNRFRRPRPKELKEDTVAVSKKKGYSSDQDDWDLPKGDLPY